MSKAYELFMPAVFDVSARDESVSKNSCTLSGISVAPCRGRARVYAPPPASQRYRRAPMTKVEIGLPEQAGADAVALPVSQPLSAASVDDKLGGRLRKLGESGDLRGECGEAVLLHLDGELDAPRLVAAGVGRRDQVDADALRTAGAATAQALSRVGGTLVWLLDESLPVPLPEQAAALVEGTILGAYSPGRWKSKQETRAPERIVVGHAGDLELQEAVERAAIVAERANRSRDLSNMPPNELTPHTLGEKAQELAHEHEHLRCEILGTRELDELGMGALTAVGRGSRNEPRLIVLRYDPPGARDDVVLGLVGKSITFDAGGISIKPAGGMQDMKGDMAGGAGTLHGIGALAALGTPARAIAALAAAENLPGGDAFRPGDILRAANGKTIEVVNTDAEGRLVLADALWYVRREGATHVLDLATLTGAMELALGDLYAGAFANDEQWGELIVEAGRRSGDLVWPFPLHPRYRRYIDSAFADLKNSSTLRQGSPALAAEFLHEFAGDGPWCHVDMAGPAFLERSRGDYLRVPGGTGWGVRLIAELGRMVA
ncbi:MAG: leucyl aminopeptidase [Actinobacteria bacterium]|nr:MAG: leucyl aminopeptidase [Actinomycetota bacterium]